MFTELTTVEAVHCVTFITKAALQAWKALFSFREHAGSSIAYIRAGKKGLKLFIVNVDLKIKEESWHPNEAPSILLFCGIRQIIKPSSKKVIISCA